MTSTLLPTTGPDLAPDLVLPLYGTPRNLERETYGRELNAVAVRLGKPFIPWQQHVADVGLEIDPATGELWYDEVVITVPRQSGKTTLILVWMVWRCTLFARRLGSNQTVYYLAQSGKMARRKLIFEFIPLLRRARGFTEIRNSRGAPVKPTEWKPSTNNGSENLLFGTDSRIQIEAPTDDGSHGDIIDMPVLDEAFAHQTDVVEQAVDAATITRRSPQLLVLSTVGTRQSHYLWGKVQAGRVAVDDPTSRMAYFEWSVPLEADWHDPTVWRKHLPAVGHTITVARLAARLAKALLAADDKADNDGFTQGVAGFRRGYMNQWLDVPLTLSARGPRIPAGRWEGCQVDRLVAGMMSERPVTLAFAASRDGEWGTIAVAAGSVDAPYVEVVEHRRGTAWLPERVAELVARYRLPVGCNAAGETGGMVHLVEYLVRGKVRLLGAAEYAQSCAGLLADVEAGRLSRPFGQAPLDAAAAVAQDRKLGSGWAWHTDSDVPISPLEAVTVARGMLPRVDRGPAQGGMMTV